MNQPNSLNVKSILFAGLIVVVLMFLLSAYAWLQIPAGDKIPVHWGVDGQPDRYGSKMEGLLLTPSICIGLTVLFWGIPYIEPRKFHLESSLKAYKIIAYAILAFMAAVHVATVLSSLGKPIKINVVVPMGVGLLFILIGNYMGKIRSNFFCGIRTPWTLSSELSWNKTHRLGGKLFCLLGLCIFLSPFIGEVAVTVWIILSGAVGMLVTLFLYSFWVWKNDPNKQTSGR